MNSELTRNSLEIIIVTYNRQKYLARTLDVFLAENSPVRDCKITVLDNNSEDGTAQCAAACRRRHSNVFYQKNKYNIGISGNIFRAMEIAESDYAWIVGDDDCYDFSSWDAVVSMMEKGEKVICLSRYLLPDSLNNDVAAQLVQISFITGLICHRSIFTDAAMRDAIYNIHSLFPHLMPVVHHINRGGRISVVDKAVSDNGLFVGEDREKDCSYNRGVSTVDELSPRTRSMIWMVGWSVVCQSIHDTELRERAFNRGVECIHKSRREFLSCLKAMYSRGSYNKRRSLSMMIGDVFAVAPDEYVESLLPLLPQLQKRTLVDNLRLFRYKICSRLIWWKKANYLRKIREYEG